MLFCAAVLISANQVDAQSPAEPDAVVKFHVINTDNVYVRSGASQSYYPIGKVQKGQVVEVTGSPRRVRFARLGDAGQFYASVADRLGWLRSDHTLGSPPELPRPDERFVQP